MANLGTDCNGCCFFDSSIKDCKNNLISVFKERGARIINTDNAPQIDRICQYRRNADWHLEKDEEYRIKLIKEEVYIRGTVILLADNAERLSLTIEKLNHNSNIKNFKLVILFNGISHSCASKICTENVKSDYKLITIVEDDISYQIYKCLKFAKHGFLFIVDSNKDFDIDMIDKVNHFVNKKMFRTLYIKGTDQFHQSVAMAHLYKFLKGDNATSYENKILEISKEENSDPQIFTWEDINEQYSS